MSRILFILFYLLICFLTKAFSSFSSGSLMSCSPFPVAPPLTVVNVRLPYRLGGGGCGGFSQRRAGVGSPRGHRSGPVPREQGRQRPPGLCALGILHSGSFLAAQVGGNPAAQSPAGGGAGGGKSSRPPEGSGDGHRAGSWGEAQPCLWLPW